jgi:hypothetical protein
VKRFKQWMWEFFLWRIEVRLSGKKDDARIVTLANMLMDECERQGYDTKGSTDDVRLLYVWSFLDSYKNRNLHIQTSHAPGAWRVEGSRTA